jgi:hypothetical protein
MDEFEVKYLMRFEVLVAVPVKIAVLRNVTRCSLVGNSVSEKPAAPISRGYPTP